MRLNLPPPRLRLFDQMREILRFASQVIVVKTTSLAALRKGVVSLVTTLRKGNTTLFRRLRPNLNFEAIGLPPLFAVTMMRVAWEKRSLSM
jgi:hypothetical protein